MKLRLVALLGLYIVGGLSASNMDSSALRSAQEQSKAQLRIMICAANELATKTSKIDPGLSAIYSKFEEIYTDSLNGTRTDSLNGTRTDSLNGTRTDSLNGTGTESKLDSFDVGIC